MTEQEIKEFLRDLKLPELGSKKIEVNPKNDDAIYIYGNGDVEYSGEIIGSLFDEKCTYGITYDRMLSVGGYQFNL